MRPSLMLVDDDKEFIADVSLLLEQEYDCIVAGSAAEALRQLDQNNPDIVLLDLMLESGSNGLDVLTEIQRLDRDLPVIMITDYASIDTAVKAMRLGASDYISKTPNMKELNLVIEKALRHRLTQRQKESLEQELQKSFQSILGDSLAIQRVKQQISLFAMNDSTVLITGESGVGKELVARQIHLLSDRQKRPFIGLNCAAIPRELMESELFGHEKGAFTGAVRRTIGKFELAEDGVLFLDEIAELETGLQVKLLRVLQEREYDRVGGNRTFKTRARILASTNRDLAVMVRQGTFREDLFYRLNVLPIIVPPLRDRKEDIPLLVNHFVRQSSLDLKVPVKEVDEAAMELFVSYDWPGNVRELQNYVTRAVITSGDNPCLDGDIVRRLFVLAASPDEEFTEEPKTWKEMNRLRSLAAERARRKVEKQFLESLLRKFGGNVTKAAGHIGINRTNFHKMMKKAGVGF